MSETPRRPETDAAAGPTDALRALDRRGVQTLLPPGESSCVLTSYRIPEGMSYEGIHNALKQWGFVIYAGQGALAQHVFRIANMGDISDADWDRLLDSLSRHL